MKHFFYLLSFLFVQLVYAQTDQDLVKKCFTNYKQAILEGRGNDAANQVDSKTIQYYGKELNLALTGDSATVNELNLLDKVTVLMVRHRIPVGQLVTMTGRDLFIYSVDNGMIGKNSVMTIELGDVKVEGNFANGQMVSGGQKTPLYFQFKKEGNEWRIDLTSLFVPSNMALTKMIEDQGI